MEKVKLSLPHRLDIVTEARVGLRVVGVSDGDRVCSCGFRDVGFSGGDGYFSDGLWQCSPSLSTGFSSATIHSILPGAWGPLPLGALEGKVLRNHCGSGVKDVR